MAKSRFAKQWKKANDIQKKASEEVINNQCECPHQDVDGYNALTIVHKGDQKAYRCNNCQKIISITAPKKDEAEDAANIIDTALDMLKINLNPKKENQQKIIDLCAQGQKILRKLVPVYSQLLNEANNENRKKKTGHKSGAIVHID